MRLKKLAALLTLTVATAAFAAGCGSGSSATESTGSGKAASGDTIRMIAASGFSDDTYLGQGYLVFKDYVEEHSDGRIQVDVFNNGTLQTTDAVGCDLLSSGGMHIGNVGFSFLGTYTNDTRYTFDAIPYYLMPDGKDNDRWLYFADHSDVMKELGADLEKSSGIKIAGFTAGGNVGFAYKGDPVTDSLDPLKGIKVRAPENDAYMIPDKALGFNPTPLAMSEVYTSIQQGAIDGVNTSGTVIVDYGFDEVTDVMLDIGLFPSAYTYCLNADFYNSLPEDLQQVVDDGVDAMEDYTRNAYKENFANVKTTFEDAGKTYIPFEGKVAELVMEAVQPSIEEARSKIDPDFLAKVDEEIDKYGAEFDALQK